MAPRNEENWQVHYPEIKMRSAHLLRTRDWTDCSFQFQTGGTATEGGSKGSLTAHKLILAMASPVFAAMFYGDVGNKEFPIIITDIDLPTFSLLLEYIYTDEVRLSDTQLAVNLYGAANKYILVHLEKICLDFLFKKLDSNNVCQIYEFSCLYGEEELKKKCLELISAKTIDVLKTPSFRNIHVETLKHVVSMESLNIDSEMDLFNAVVVYMDNMKCTDDENLTVQSSESITNVVDVELPLENANQYTEESKELISEKRRIARNHLPGVVEQIRFLTLTPADLVENGEIATVLTKDEMLALLANSASCKTTIPMPEGFSISRDIRKPPEKGTGPVAHVAPAYSLEPPPDSTSSVVVLEWTCRKHGLPQPLYKVHEILPRRRSQARFACTCKVGTNYTASSSSLPTEDLAKAVVAAKLLAVIESSADLGILGGSWNFDFLMPA